MARAIINRSECEPFADELGTDQLRYKFSVLFYGPNVLDADTGARRIDSSIIVVEVTPPTNAAQVTTAKNKINDAIQARATQKGYGILTGKPQHVEELLHSL